MIRCNDSAILLASATILMGKLSRFGGVEFELVAIVFDPDSQLLLLLQRSDYWPLNFNLNCFRSEPIVDEKNSL